MKNCLMSVNVFFLANRSVLNSRSTFLCKRNFVRLAKSFYLGLELLFQDHWELEFGHERHPGIVVMKRNLRSKVWWPGMDKDVEKECRTCYECQLVSIPAKPEPMHRTQLPSAPWEHLAAVFFGSITFGRFVVCSCWLLFPIQDCWNNEIHNRRENCQMFEEDL